MLSVYHDVDASMISAMCRSLGITPAIDEMVEWIQGSEALPQSQGGVMIANIFTGRKPLHEVLQGRGRIQDFLDPR